MPKIRILCVDDSVVIRRLLRQVFSADDCLEVVGVAANGRIALSMLQNTNPDVVTLDIEMPEMDGLETLKAIREVQPKLPVIMFSTLTERGAVATIEALALGATDYATKPVDASNFASAVRQIQNQLISKVKAIYLKASASRPAFQHNSSSPAVQKTARNRSVPSIIAIGTSTGGPNALAEVLPHLPGDCCVPVVIVQHMPPIFTRFLADRLSTTCKIPVHEAKDGELLEPGTAVIAPGDYHMRIVRDGTRLRVRTDQAPPENSCRPSVDVLFRSVGELFGSEALAVVMTGMGQDGLIGCEWIHGRGGTVLVQDEPTSVVWGMPGFVTKAGLADQVLPLQQIGTEIVRRLRPM